MSATALLVSDDPSLVEACQKLVGTVSGLRLVSIPHPRGADPHVLHPDLALVLLHVAHADQANEAARLLRLLADSRRPVATLAIGESDLAEQGLQLLRLGAADYLSRPLDLDRLAYLIDALTLRTRYAAKPAAAAPTVAASEPACSPALEAVMDQVRLVAEYDSTILIGGETGTGKTRLARLIHQLSPRAREPFVVVNCGSLAANVIESELFGHVKGAFTGADRERQGKLAAAGRGTLVLDDIDTLPLSSQARLLRAVEEKLFEPVGSNRSFPLRARVLAASNRNLAEEVEAGRFRADLYYRLHVVHLVMPPLREHREAIATLGNEFVSEFASRYGKVAPRIPSSVLEALTQYDWPGNIRELRNVMEQVVVMCREPSLSLRDLPPAVLAAAQREEPVIAVHRPEVPLPVTDPGLTLGEARGDAEATRILAALRRHRNNRLRAAAELGISRMTLYKKLHKYGLQRA